MGEFGFGLSPVGGGIVRVGDEGRVVDQEASVLFAVIRSHGGADLVGTQGGFGKVHAVADEVQGGLRIGADLLNGDRSHDPVGGLGGDLAGRIEHGAVVLGLIDAVATGATLLEDGVAPDGEATVYFAEDVFRPTGRPQTLQRGFKLGEIHEER